MDVEREMLYPARERETGDCRGERTAEAATLVRVDDRDREVGESRIAPVDDVADDADARLVVHGHERDVTYVVDIHQGVQHPGREPRERRKKRRKRERGDSRSKAATISSR